MTSATMPARCAHPPCSTNATWPHAKLSLEPFVDAGIRLIHHCDGNVMPLIDDMIAAGFSGFQGFQYECGVDLTELRRRRSPTRRADHPPRRPLRHPHAALRHGRGCPARSGSLPGRHQRRQRLLPLHQQRHRRRSAAGEHRRSLRSPGGLSACIRKAWFSLAASLTPRP